MLLIEQTLLGVSMDEALWDKVFKRELFKDINFLVGEINEDIVIMPTIIGRC